MESYSQNVIDRVLNENEFKENKILNLPHAVVLRFSSWRNVWTTFQIDPNTKKRDTAGLLKVWISLKFESLDFFITTIKNNYWLSA